MSAGSFFENADGEFCKTVEAIVCDDNGATAGEEIFPYDDEDSLILEIERNAEGEERDYHKAIRIFIEVSKWLVNLRFHCNYHFILKCINHCIVSFRKQMKS